MKLSAISYRAKVIKLGFATFTNLGGERPTRIDSTSVSSAVVRPCILASNAIRLQKPDNRASENYEGR